MSQQLAGYTASMAETASSHLSRIFQPLVGRHTTPAPKKMKLKPVTLLIALLQVDCLDVKLRFENFSKTPSYWIGVSGADPRPERDVCSATPLEHRRFRRIVYTILFCTQVSFLELLTLTFTPADTW